ncbi:MAG: hypothetical protein KDC41_09670, partial [Saprospiraceae bacterium]|nr:hypothetical protein [Saprospiraceae bacterium]
LARAAWER